MRKDDIIASVERYQGVITLFYERTPIISGNVGQLATPDVYDAVNKHPDIPSDVRGWLKTAYDIRSRQGEGSSQLDKFNIGADVEGFLAL